MPVSHLGESDSSADKRLQGSSSTAKEGYRTWSWCHLSSWRDFALSRAFEGWVSHAWPSNTWTSCTQQPWPPSSPPKPAESNKTCCSGWQLRNWTACGSCRPRRLGTWWKSSRKSGARRRVSKCTTNVVNTRWHECCQKLNARAFKVSADKGRITTFFQTIGLLEPVGGKIGRYAGLIISGFAFFQRRFFKLEKHCQSTFDFVTEQWATKEWEFHGKCQTHSKLFYFRRLVSHTVLWPIARATCQM